MKRARRPPPPAPAHAIGRSNKLESSRFGRGSCSCSIGQTPANREHRSYKTKVLNSSSELPNGNVPWLAESVGRARPLPAPRSSWRYLLPLLTGDGERRRSSCPENSTQVSARCHETIFEDDTPSDSGSTTSKALTIPINPILWLKSSKESVH
ncbi:hypothetical protein EVAR_89030_1 [Eumeta japonica]|uniref:Uncharacterized protein n=1 Tax=Eumeta variegata TaxID=151549 RepID=A0A4C1Z427_EUMVA|nr:hypothetical protein EVAR_89030_1 [Eumeta japonica]